MNEECGESCLSTSYFFRLHVCCFSSHHSTHRRHAAVGVVACARRGCRNIACGPWLRLLGRWLWLWLWLWDWCWYGYGYGYGQQSRRRRRRRFRSDSVWRRRVASGGRASVPRRHCAVGLGSGFDFSSRFCFSVSVSVNFRFDFRFDLWCAPVVVGRCTLHCAATDDSARHYQCAASYISSSSSRREPSEQCQCWKWQSRKCH